MNVLKKLNFDHYLMLAVKTVYWGLVIVSSVKTGNFHPLESALGGSAIILGGGVATRVKGKANN